MRILNLFPPSPPPPAPAVPASEEGALTSPVKSKRQKTTPPAGNAPPADLPAFVHPREPFKLTYAHVLAYRKFQLRQPSGSERPPKFVGCDTGNGSLSSDADCGQADSDARTGKRVAGKRKLCIAEAAWELWAEKGGLGTAGKKFREKKALAKARAKARAHDKGKGKGMEQAGGTDVDDEGLDEESEEEPPIRACMAYSYDENGDRECPFHFWGARKAGRCRVAKNWPQWRSRTS